MFMFEHAWCKRLIVLNHMYVMIASSAVITFIYLNLHVSHIVVYCLCKLIILYYTGNTYRIHCVISFLLDTNSCQPISTISIELFLYSLAITLANVVLSDFGGPWINIKIYLFLLICSTVSHTKFLQLVNISEIALFVWAEWVRIVLMDEYTYIFFCNWF